MTAAVESIVEGQKRSDFSQNSFDMPSVLDRVLHREIEGYRQKPGNSYTKLSEELNQFVRSQYTDCWNFVEIGRVSSEELEKNIRYQVPSEKYIRDYCNGRPICFRYTNTIANFFGLEYQIRNFNPAKDFEIASALQGD